MYIETALFFIVIAAVFALFFTFAAKAASRRKT